MKGTWISRCAFLITSWPLAKIILTLLNVIWWEGERTHGLDNGLALTPPMGFNTWQRYRCSIDCEKYPDSCLNDKLIRRIADIMSSEYLDAGYKYLVIDDCWSYTERAFDGNLQEDPDRFPKGMRAISNYVHSKGLLFGLYGNLGLRTCMGYPGIWKNLRQDAMRFVEYWNVDYIKLDGCLSSPEEKEKSYPEFGQYLNKSGKPILYSCSWPYYLYITRTTANYTAVSQTCNLWRNYEDIEDSWESVLSISQWYAVRQHALARFHGPGQWNDPDALVIGNYGLSYEQAKSQMALWCIMGAPLFISTDLARIRPEFKEILLNRGAIAVNQDRMGKMGKRISESDGFHVWRKAMYTGKFLSYPSCAVAVVNTLRSGSPRTFSISIDRLYLRNPFGYHVEDIFTGQTFVVKFDDTITIDIPPTGVAFWKFTAIDRDFQDPNEPFMPDVFYTRLIWVGVTTCLLSVACLTKFYFARSVRWLLKL